jgi:serine/threonine-protein kinase
MAIAYKHLSDRVPPPSTRVPSLPPDLDGFVGSATERERELRPESAGEMRRDLAAISVTLPIEEPIETLVGDPPIDVGDGRSDMTAVVVGPATADTIPPVEPRASRRWPRRLALVVLAPGGVIGGPWRKAIYLRSNNSSHKFAGTIREFKWSKKKSVRLQHQFNVVACERCIRD